MVKARLALASNSHDTNCREDDISNWTFGGCGCAAGALRAGAEDLAVLFPLADGAGFFEVGVFGADFGEAVFFGAGRFAGAFCCAGFVEVFGAAFVAVVLLAAGFLAAGFVAAGFLAADDFGFAPPAFFAAGFFTVDDLAPDGFAGCLAIT